MSVDGGWVWVTGRGLDRGWDGAGGRLSVSRWRGLGRCAGQGGGRLQLGRARVMAQGESGAT